MEGIYEWEEGGFRDRRRSPEKDTSYMALRKNLVIPRSSKPPQNTEEPNVVFIRIHQVGIFTKRLGRHYMKNAFLYLSFFHSVSHTFGT